MARSAAKSAKKHFHPSHSAACPQPNGDMSLAGFTEITEKDLFKENREDTVSH